MAATINFKRLVTHEAVHVLEDLMDSLGAPVLVCDSAKKTMIGDERARGKGEFPVWLAGRTIGWVMGPPKAYSLASTLTYLSQQELEKREITAKVLDRESEINLIQDISEKIAASMEVADIAMALVDEVTGAVESTGASIMLINEETGLLDIVAAFGRKVKDRPVLKPGVGIVGDVLLTGVPEIVNDVTQDPRYVPGAFPVCSLICVPIATRDRVIGAMNISNQRSMNYQESDVKLALTLATHAALAIEKARRLQEASEGPGASSSPPPDGILQFIGKAPSQPVAPGDFRMEEMSILFSGMRSYAEHYAALSPQENFQFLGDYLAGIGPPVIEHGGLPAKSTGDGVMALFPPQAGPDKALDAAIAMQRQVRIFSENRRKASQLPVSMGVGIHTGIVTLGAVEHHSGVESTILGDPVAIACRMERLSKLYGLNVAISGATYQALSNKNAYQMREVDMVQIPGKEATITVYDVFSADPDGIRDTKNRCHDSFTEALRLFRGRRWEEALRILDRLKSLMPFDRVVTLYLNRCLAFSKSPPGDSWAGVFRLSGI